MDIKTVEGVFKLQAELNDRFLARVEAVQRLKPAETARATKEHEADLLAMLKSRIKLATDARGRALARYDEEIRGYEAAIEELRGESPKKSRKKAPPKPK